MNQVSSDSLHEAQSSDETTTLLDRALTDDEVEDLTEGDEAPTSVSFSTQDYPIDGLVNRLKRRSMTIPRFQKDEDDAIRLPVTTASFQRGFVWTKAQMDRFIESLLLGYPIPGIFLVKQAPDNRLLVLDGQQRLETLLRFYEGMHAGREFTLQNVGEEYRGKSYKTLDEASKNLLDDSYMQATIVQSDGSTELNEAIYKIFERLNAGGTQLTPHEIRVALYAGEFVSFIEDLNSTKSWRDLFGTRSKRIRDHELVMRVIALYHFSEEYSRPLKKFLNQTAARLRALDGLQENTADLFDLACAQIMQEVGPDAFRSAGGRQVNAAQTEAILVELMRAKSEGRAVTDLDARIQALKRNPEFVRATTRSTADKDAVSERLKLAAEAMSS